MGALDEAVAGPKLEARAVDGLLRFVERRGIAFRLNPVCTGDLSGSIKPVQPVCRQARTPTNVRRLTWNWTNWIHLGYSDPQLSN